MRGRRGLVRGLAEAGRAIAGGLIVAAWLVISPWALGYRGLGTLTAMQVILGALVAALALLEPWQDRGLTDNAAWRPMLER
jgi:hypothetical protein